MALLKARNKDLIAHGREHTVLTQPVDAGSPGLTVEDNNGFAQNDLVIIGEIGADGTEVCKITAAVTYGTALTAQGSPTAYGATGPVFSHPTGTPVYRTDYDQVLFYRATSFGGAKTLLATETLQPDDIHTRYNDTANTTGFGSFRFRNSVTAAFSPYSDDVSYVIGYNDLSLHAIRERARNYLKDRDDKPIVFFEDYELDEAISDSQRDIAQELELPSFEAKASFSSVANQREYDLNTFVDADGNRIYWGRLYTVTFRTQPLIIQTLKEYQALHWDANSTGDPSHIHVRNKALIPWPINSGAAQATTLSGNVATTDTTLNVVSTSGFPAKGRLIINSEVMEYDSITSTTFVLSSVSQRGMEGTTAAAHVATDPVTDRDVIVTFFAKPTVMRAETDETQLEDPDLVAVDAALILIYNRAPDDKGLIDRLEARRDKRMELYKKKFGDKYANNFGRVRRKNELPPESPYWPAVQNPQNIG